MISEPIGPLPMSSRPTWLRPVPDAPAIDVAELFRLHYTAMLRLAVLLVDDRGTAEDAVQDAFVGLQRHRDVPADPDAAVAYLRAAVVNRCRSTLRHRYVVAKFLRRAQLDDAGPDPTSAVAEDDALLEALRTLPQRQREVLVLRYWADLTHADIARTLHLAEGSVKSAASRGLAALRARMETS